MKFLNYSFSDPESNLALDEALLEEAEAGRSGEVLRFWESPVYFVVLGISSKWQIEANADTCKKSGIPILRRKSGGATVLQGPGCFNFALIQRSPENSGIKSDTKRIMEKNREAASAWKLPGEVKVQGISDLTCGNFKFSGNAMRRGRNFHLFHGTFLYGFDLEKVGRYLGSPERQPDYRNKRPHSEFIRNIPVKKELIERTLRSAWAAEEEIKKIPLDEVARLKNEIYSKADWNLRH